MVLGVSACNLTPTPSPTTPPPVSRWDMPQAGAPNFGYGLMRSSDFAGHYTEARFWPDRRPVIMAPLDFSDLPLHRPISEIESSIDGPSGTLNTKEFFALMSGNQTQIYRLRTLSTVHAAVPRAQNTSDLERSLLLRQALDEGFDFSAYDTNHDGTISDAELLLVTIVADAPGTGGGGAVRNFCNTVMSTDGTRRVRFCGRSASFSEFAGYHVISHELSHIFGTIDLYNGNELATNFFVTLMGIGGSSGVLLDPYHRIKLGWLSGRPVNIANPAKAAPAVPANSCYRLMPSQLGSVDASSKPLVIYDSRRGVREYFILEYRRKTGFDIGAYDEGIALWYVHEGANGFADTVPISTRRGPGPARTLASLGPSGMPAGDDGILRAWADGGPLYLTPGANMFFDTPLVLPDEVNAANAVLNYPPGHMPPGVSIGPRSDRLLGFPKFWSAQDLAAYPITWYDPYSGPRGGPTPIGVQIVADPLPTDPNAAINVHFIYDSALPRAKACLP